MFLKSSINFIRMVSKKKSPPQILEINLKKNSRLLINFGGPHISLQIICVYVSVIYLIL